MLFYTGNSAASKTVAERVIAGAPDIIRSLIPLSYRKENILIRLVAENLGFFCAIGKMESCAVACLGTFVGQLLRFSIHVCHL